MKPEIKELTGVGENQILAGYTTFKIGGVADWFYQVKNETDLIKAISFCRKQKIPFFILGGGSNLLVSDKGFRGMVIKMENEMIKVDNEKIIVESGSSLARLIKIAMENSLSGLEFLAGIPGTVGGSIVGNAGAWQENFSDKIKRVKILDGKDQVKWFNQEDCQFSYRQSRFKKSKEIILAVEIELKKAKQKDISQKISDNLKKRKNQPQEPSAGSIFINPKPNSASDLIENCGLKGVKRGGAEISDKHANFIVNRDGAKAKDVLELISLAKQQVKEKFGIDLKTEIFFLGGSK
ncbi:MAG: UDP-N-acetylmuramate dehydrogenase [Candidatus Shapirobacteria bacterium]|nr:UDP-N-acetylmuramate dehydrogenase [Candidatus Shapirobacteria bacterium]